MRGRTNSIQTICKLGVNDDANHRQECRGEEGEEVPEPGAMIFILICSLKLLIVALSGSWLYTEAESGKQMTKGCLIIQKHERISWGSDYANTELSSS